jgi:hypothetical protein
MRIFDKIQDNLEAEFDEVKTLAGLDDAVIGIDSNSNRLIYSQSKIIETLMKTQNWSMDESLDWYYNNIECTCRDPYPIISSDLYG